MHGGSFVDTNVWVYAHLVAPGDPRHSIALDLVSGLTDAVISPQVAAEYYNVMLRAGREDAWIQANLTEMLDFAACPPLTEQVIRRSWALRNRYRFSHWDAQVLAAALQSGCTRLYTEDLQHGQRIEGLIVIDPFQAYPGGIQEPAP